MVASSKVIIIIAIISILSFENCDGYFQAYPSFLKKTPSKVFADELEKTTANPPTTKTKKKCSFKTIQDCTLREWIKFYKRILRH